MSALRWWAIPSFSGDLRLIPSDDGKTTRLEIHKPTLGEKQVLDAIQAEAVKRGWITDSGRAERSGFFWRKKRIILNAPIEITGPVVAKIMRPGPAVLTALAMVGGSVIVTEGAAIPVPPPQTADSGPYRASEKPTELAPAPVGALVAPAEPAPPPAPPLPPPPPAAVAATVKRPTPCCPQCVPGSIEPAREVLLPFLTAEQHASWARSRTLVVEGGLTGHRYLVAHRHTRAAQRIGRLCFDIDDDAVMHFHDWSVPPEEEVLATKLILEHREGWLRNEATCLGNHRDVFKNPFGGGGDGVEDALFTQQIGAVLDGALRGFTVGLAARKLLD